MSREASIVGSPGLLSKGAIVARPISYDTETTGLRLHSGDRMFSYSTCTTTGQCAANRLDGTAVRKVRNRQRLARLWKDAVSHEVEPIMHNAKFDLTATEYELGVRLADNVSFHDTMVQSHLLQNNHPSHALKSLAWELANVPVDDEKVVRAIVGSGGNYQMVPKHLMDEYQFRDAERTMLLHLFFYPKIQRNPQLREIYTMELDLVRTTMRMEKRGVMVRPEATRQVVAELAVKVDEVLDAIEDFAGYRVNPDKTNDLYWLLFDKAELPVLKRTKTNKPSTTKEDLRILREKYHHPVLEMVAQYRSWSRGVTMLQSYLDKADAEWVLHPDIRTVGPKTGRESCRDPNLQNVQKAGALLNPYPIPARKCFRPRPGYVNIHIDYSGIEMVLAIFYSRDALLLKVLREDGDPHEPGCQLFFGDEFTKLDKGSKERAILRSGVKNANFGIIYGARGSKIAGTLGKDMAWGMAKYREYHETFHGICGLMPAVATQVRETGYVETAFGRELHVPRNKAYMGTNYLIQGTAAGVLKRAQNRVRKVLDDGTGGEAQILLPIHDELVVEWPRKRLNDVPDVLPSIVQVMTNFPEFDIPLKVDMELATVNWADKRPLRIGGRTW
jgi:DNA polymerase-1